tara:strand:+ start:7777 stop:9042 length:1266 start_codon:yes stop_codon:yes gene_type:complete
MDKENFKITNCRLCGSEKLKYIISLGDQHIVNFVKSKEEPCITCPLELILCEDCKFLQLRHNASSESMWGDQYWYKSSINKMIKEDLKDIVDKAKKLISLEEKDIVVDIGCNDGTMLGFYDKDKLDIVGFEPSGNVAKESEQKGFNIINNFFNAENFKEKIPNRKAKIITAISMFYDLENPNKFLEDINEILDENGLFIIQQNYLVTMLENNAFDNICHEHRGYYSYYSLKNLLDRHNLEVFDIELNEINGGSIRTYIRKKNNQEIKPFDGSEIRIDEIIEREKNLNLENVEPYQDFASRIESIKKQLLDFIKNEKSKGKKIYGLGASTRGSVLLQYFELGPELIDYIFDKNPDKEERMVAGSWIPITHPKNIEKHNPDYQIVLIWHIFEGIGDDEKEFLKKGGKFILPLPEFKIIDEIND